MRRAVAAILLAIIGFPLIGSAMNARSFGSTPACCRRDGKHRCEMANTAAQDGPGIASARCASWGNPAVALVDVQIMALAVETHRSAPPIAQTRNFRLPVTIAAATSPRSVPKRGPPCPLQ